MTKSSTSSSSDEKSTKVDWPQPVREYVQRAFMPEHNIPGIGRVEMEKKLKETITRANERNALHTIDWDDLPLPQQMIHSERTPPDRFPSGTSWRPQTYLSRREANGSEMTVEIMGTKKRKSSELYHPGQDDDDHDDDAPQPPWHKKTNRRNILEDRISTVASDLGGRLSFQHGSPDAKSGKESSKFHRGEPAKRPKRFDSSASGAAAVQHPWTPPDHSPVAVQAEGPVVGRSQSLEKRYFRLTAPPNPDTVRPLPVLRKTLDLLKRKWKDENNYSYICDQFKSLRQDLTVQHITNDFTIQIYEIHARIALEKGDLGEYNQCQTQLRALYPKNAGGHPTEFKAYRILYFLHTCNRTDMNHVLADLTPAEKSDPAVKHALDVRSALALGNYHRFFRLYLDTPNMGAYLMDMFVERERLAALANICRAYVLPATTSRAVAPPMANGCGGGSHRYKPDVRLRFLTEELGFESDQETVGFCSRHQAQALLEERDDCYRFLSAKAGPTIESAKVDAFRRIDIKGQL